MNEKVEYEEVLVGVAVDSEAAGRVVSVGDKIRGMEIFSLKITKNTEQFFTVLAYDEDGNHIYTLNVMKPLVVEIFKKTIAVDGPPEQ